MREEIMKVRICLALLVSIPWLCADAQPAWRFEQVSSEDVENERLPSIWDGKIAWAGGWYANSEIYYWDGQSTRQISDNVYSATGPSLYDGRIAWEQYVGDDREEIFYWDGSQVTQITSYDGIQQSPSLWGDTIMWNSIIEESDGTSRYDIYGWDGADVDLVKESASSPSLYGDGIAYKRSVGSHSNEVFLWDGEKELQITNTPGRNVYSLSLWDGQIVYELGISSSESEIWFWDGTTNEMIFANGHSNYNPCLQNGYVAWGGFDGNDFEIFLWDGKEVHQVTDNTWDDTNPSLWIDGLKIQIAYDSLMEDYDYEIMLAVATIPEPSVLVMGFGGLLLSVVFVKRRRG